MRLPPFILELLPHSPEFWEWVTLIKELWNQYNALAILVGLWLVARKLTSERERLSDQVGTLGQHISAGRETADAAIASARETAELLQRIADQNRTTPLEPVAPAVLYDPANWATVSAIWREIKDRMELKIESISHRSTRRKYSRLPRVTYKDVIDALLKDGFIGRGVANQLNQLDTAFHTLKFRPKKVTQAEAERFREGLQIVDRELPDLPEEAVADLLSLQNEAREQAASESSSKEYQRQSQSQSQPPPVPVRPVPARA